MFLNNYWVCFESAVPAHICDEIIKFGCNKQSQKARIGTNDTLDELLKI